MGRTRWYCINREGILGDLAEFGSEVSLARKLVANGFSGKEQSVRSYLNQVFNGRRPVSERLLRALETLAGDSVNLRRHFGYRDKLPIHDPYFAVFESFVHDARNRYADLNDSDRLRMAADLRGVYEQYDPERQELTS